MNGIVKIIYFCVHFSCMQVQLSRTFVTSLLVLRMRIYCKYKYLQADAVEHQLLCPYQHRQMIDHSPKCLFAVNRTVQIYMQLLTCCCTFSP